MIDLFGDSLLNGIVADDFDLFGIWVAIIDTEGVILLFVCNLDDARIAMVIGQFDEASDILAAHAADVYQAGL